MTVKYCCVVGCNSDSRKYAKHGKYPWMKDVRFFPMPNQDTIRNRTLFRKWVKLINRKDWKPTVYTSVCSRHFVDKEPTNANPLPTLLMAPSSGKSSPKRRANNRGNPPSANNIQTDLPNIDSVDENLSLDPVDLTLNNDNIVSMKVNEAEDSELIIVPQDGINVVEVPIPAEPNKRPSIGEMSEFMRSATPTDEHDYAHQSPKKTAKVETRDTDVQTDINMVQFDEMQQKASRLNDKPKLRRELFTEYVLKDDNTVNKFTGVRSRSLLDGLFCLLVSSATRMKYWTGQGSAMTKNYELNPNLSKSGPKRKLEPFTEFLLTLVRLRLGIPLFAMNALFGIGSTVSSNTFTTWITLMYQTFMPLIKWPSRRKIDKHMPASFKKSFPATRSIIDCTEFFTEKPNSPMAQSTTYSTYKSHNTAKLLVGVTPSGSFHFLSRLYGGNTSDRYITKDSGFLDKVEPGDGIMADRGFTIQDLLLKKRAKLIIPPFTHKVTVGKGKRLTPRQIRTTQNVARLRIHVERAIGRLKNFRLIGNVIPMSLKYVTQQMITVSAFLCNLMSLLVKK